ncbi:hypothetical protein PAHAL_6G271600 [Panicum hallii]|uniref:Uncharacterized protein n=1 Tax=Panicum hallii TaxID=206008 RepID=A0A2T8IHQ2_9POAL|nr:hypothetical protein PAHAL_6G271600 [Panicum hallii]
MAVARSCPPPRLASSPLSLPHRQWLSGPVRRSRGLPRHRGHASLLACGEEKRRGRRETKVGYSFRKMAAGYLAGEVFTAALVCLAGSPPPAPSTYL